MSWNIFHCLHGTKIISSWKQQVSVFLHSHGGTRLRRTQHSRLFPVIFWLIFIFTPLPGKSRPSPCTQWQRRPDLRFQNLEEDLRLRFHLSLSRSSGPRPAPRGSVSTLEASTMRSYGGPWTGFPEPD